MSTFKPKKKGHSQAHQNKEKWHHNPNSALTKKIMSIEHFCLCYRCEAQIEWRKTYRKYKPLKAMRRCNGCQEHAVNRAYHTFCDACAQARGICAKCGKTYDISKKVKPMSDQEMLDLLKKSEIKEKYKRTILRNWEKGLFYNDDIAKMINLILDGQVIMWQDWIIDEEEEDDDDHSGHSHGPDGKCNHSHAIGGAKAGTMEKIAKLDLSALNEPDEAPTTTTTTTTVPATEDKQTETIPETKPEATTSAQPSTEKATTTATTATTTTITPEPVAAAAAAPKKKITILPKQTTSRIGAMSAAITPTPKK